MTCYLAGRKGKHMVRNKQTYNVTFLNRDSLGDFLKMYSTMFIIYFKSQIRLNFTNL